MHQAEFFPWIGFFKKMAMCEQFVLFDNAQYNKKDFQNRNKIKCFNEYKWIKIPVRKHKITTSMKEIIIDNSTDWKKKINKSIILEYKSTPYFEEVYNLIQPILEKEWTFLFDLNKEFIISVKEYLGINTKVILSSDLVDNTELFYGLDATQKIIYICKCLNADTFISGIHGKDYLNEYKFQINQINLDYMEFYYQNSCTKFSIIHELFYHGKDTVKQFDKVEIADENLY